MKEIHEMLASPFILDQRLAELRPSDGDQRIARWLREANAAAETQRAPADAGRRWAAGGRASTPARLPAR